MQAAVGPRHGESGLDALSRKKLFQFLEAAYPGKRLERMRCGTFHCGLTPGARPRAVQDFYPLLVAPKCEGRHAMRLIGAALRRLAPLALERIIEKIGAAVPFLPKWHALRIGLRAISQDIQ
jgi:hypothetical protein